jgi:hypothetical protein
VQASATGNRSDEEVVLNDDLYVERDLEPVMIDRLRRRDFLRQPLLVAGEPGVGKSSLLWSLANKLNPNSLGKAEAWLIDAQDLLTFFGDREEDSRNRLTRLKKALGYFANGEPPVLLIDTADAVLNRRDDTLIFKDLLSQLYDLHIQSVITSRPGEAHQLSFLEPNKSDLGNYSDAEFPKAIAAYAKVFVKHSDYVSPQEHAQQLSEAASSGYPIESLARNPLALQMIYAVYAPHEINYSEINVSSLYRDYWERRVAADLRPGTPPTSASLDLTRAAELLGIAMLSEGVPELFLESIRRLPERIAINSNEINELARRGVISVSPSEFGNKLSFFHQTFFEHAAARGLVSLAGIDGLRELCGRFRSSSENHFLGCVLERSLVLADFESRELRETADAIAVSLSEANSEASSCALYAYVHKVDVSDQLKTAISALIAEGDALAIERLLDLAPNIAMERQTDLLEVFRPLMEEEDFRRGESVVKSMTRISFSHPREVSEFLRQTKPQDGVLKDPFRSALIRKAYYALLDRIAPVDPQLAWDEMVRLFSDGLSRTAGESDGLECVTILLNHYPCWARSEVAADFEAEVKKAVGNRRTTQSNDLARGMAKVYFEDWIRARKDPYELLSEMGRPDVPGSFKRGTFAKLYGLGAMFVNLEDLDFIRLAEITLQLENRELQHYVIIIVWSDIFDALIAQGRADCQARKLRRWQNNSDPERNSLIENALLKMVAYSQVDVRVVGLLDLEANGDDFSLWTDTRGLGRRILDAAEAGIESAQETLGKILKAPQRHPDRLRALAIQARFSAEERGAFRILTRLAVALNDPFIVFPVLEELKPENLDWIADPNELFRMAFNFPTKGNRSHIRDRSRYVREYERLRLQNDLSLHQLLAFADSHDDDIARAYALTAVNYRMRNMLSFEGFTVDQLVTLDRDGKTRTRAEIIQCIATIFELDANLADHQFDKLIDLAFREGSNSTHIAPISRPLYGLLDLGSQNIFHYCERIMDGLQLVSNATANSEYTRLARVFIVAGQRAPPDWTVRIVDRLQSLPPEVGRLAIGMLSSLNPEQFEEVFSSLRRKSGVPNATLKRVADLRRQRHRMIGVEAWPELLEMV